MIILGLIGVLAIGGLAWGFIYQVQKRRELSPALTPIVIFVAFILQIVLFNQLVEWGLFSDRPDSSHASCQSFTQ